MLSQTCIDFFLVLNTKEDILKNVGNSSCMVHIDFESRRGPETVCYHILQNNFCSNEESNLNCLMMVSE